MIAKQMVASCAAGLEPLVADEIRAFGGEDVEVGRGLVSWQGDLGSAYRACLWSRFASRILLELDRFTVENEDDLYSRVRQLCWEDHLDITTTFVVDTTFSSTAQLGHSRFAALRVKDAIVDRFRDRTGQRPSVDTVRPGLRVHLHVDQATAFLALDLSGESLHRRGYRVSGSKAPLKETLGAAIVAFCGWPGDGERFPALVDPMCGTGTLLIEAALMFGDSAPGLARTSFGFLAWRQHQAELWDGLVEEAMAREEAGSRRQWPFMMGYDSDYHNVSAARKNIEKAGLDDRIQIRQAELAGLQAPRATGLLLANLPYGERLSETDVVSQLYRAYGRIATERFPGWRLGAFIADPQLTDSFGVGWQEKQKLFNGSLPCRLLIADLPTVPAKGFSWELGDKEIPAEGLDFANRLKKNLKKFLPWAAKEDISCMRVYDRDLPDYNVSIDLYGKWILLQEYAPPKSVDEGLAAQRYQTAWRTVQAVFGARSDRIFIKTRQRQKGKNQYQKKDGRKKMLEVREGGCSFLVNLTDYLDTGIFLDHRPIRRQIAGLARGKRFLNLFGYTGTATVYAAMGGAASTTTVDLSETYLQWARMNLALNGCDLINHHLVKADCMQWLRAEKSKFDLIFLDPPTFSNTKKEKRVFDLQADHQELIALAMARLESTGLLIFSTNFRGFRLDPALMERCTVVDISKESVPMDFSRNARIHQCWEFRPQSLMVE